MTTPVKWQRKFLNNILFLDMLLLIYIFMLLQLIRQCVTQIRCERTQTLPWFLCGAHWSREFQGNATASSTSIPFCGKPGYFRSICNGSNSKCVVSWGFLVDYPHPPFFDLSLPVRIRTCHCSDTAFNIIKIVFCKLTSANMPSAKSTQALSIHKS